MQILKLSSSLWEYELKCEESTVSSESFAVYITRDFPWCLVDTGEFLFNSSFYMVLIFHFEVEVGAEWRIMYDKKTKVMYVMSDGPENRGVFTELVDENGKPKLWENEEE